MIVEGEQVDWTGFLTWTDWIAGDTTAWAERAPVHNPCGLLVIFRVPLTREASGNNPQAPTLKTDSVNLRGAQKSAFYPQVDDDHPRGTPWEDKWPRINS